MELKTHQGEVGRTYIRPVLTEMGGREYMIIKEASPPNVMCHYKHGGLSRKLDWYRLKPSIGWLNLPVEFNHKPLYKRFNGSFVHNNKIRLQSLWFLVFGLPKCS